MHVLKMTDYRKFTTWSVVALLTAPILALYLLLINKWAPGTDFASWMRPAVLEIMSGGNPYNVLGTYTPPWFLILIAPLATLPAKTGSFILSLANLIAFPAIAHKMGAKPMALALFTLSPFVLYNVLLAKYDFLVALGFLMPAQIGLFFVLIKPQIGAMVAVFWLAEAWKKGSVKEVIRTFAPVTLAFLASFALYGFYPSKWGQTMTIFYYEGSNGAVWPYAIPIGLALTVRAVRERSLRLSILASPLVSPYLQPGSWAVPMLGLLPSQIEMIAAVIGLWLVQIISGTPLH
jgi:hypothetical protein